MGRKFLELYGDVAFFNRQSRVALRHNGVIDPDSIEEYFHYRGFQALAKVLEKGDPQWVIEEITRSKLRGRGGGGFPTGKKWDNGAAEAADKTRYLICNADEGDPGAFMDRSMLESDPLNVVEGMIIGGFAIGAQRGFFYVRAEYPMAIQRIETGNPAVPRMGPAGQGHSGLGLRLRPGNPPRRRGLRLRRGDGADPFDRGRARPAPRPPAVSHRKRPVGQAHGDQQRRDLRQRAGGDQLRGRVVRPHRHRTKRRHQGLRPGRQGAAHRAGRGADGHHAPHGRLRNRRRRRPAESNSRPSRPAARPAAASPPSGSTWRWTSTPSPRPARSWAAAA